MKALLIALVVVELALLICSGWSVHVGNSQLRDLCTIGIACNSVLLIVAAKKARKKRDCCS
jgi:hypothetical protein